MDFINISEEEYENFWKVHPLKTFLSSPKIGTLREKINWEKEFVGIKKNNEIIAAAMLLRKRKKLGFYEYYSPRGFLLDYNDEIVLNYFLSNVIKYIKNNKGYILRIDPYVIYKERDIDGKIVEGGENNEHVVNKLLEFGFNKVSEKETEQVVWMFSLDLENKTEEQVLKEMKANTRNKIKQIEKFGIDVKELKYEELDKFQNIMLETGARRGFEVRGIKYYQDMYKLFHDSNEVKFYVTELNLKKYIEILSEEKKLKQDKLDNFKETRHNKGEKNNYIEDIKNLENKINDALSTIERVGKEVITLSGSMFILIEPEILYLSSGNYKEYMKYNSQYLIQWELIKYGISHNFKKHNFYGIPSNIDKHPENYGLYEFKKGFNGKVEELIGEYHYVFNKPYNLLLNVISKIKKVIK